MPRLFFALPLLILLTLSACGLQPEIVVPNSVATTVEMDVRRVLEDPDTIELLTLHPEALTSEERARATKEVADAIARKTFHHYRVLGRAEIGTGETERLINALYEGISENQGEVADCFNPRHGISAVRDGVRVDLVICFECLFMQVYVNGEQQDESILTSETPADVFNAVAKELELEVDKE